MTESAASRPIRPLRAGTTCTSSAPATRTPSRFPARTDNAGRFEFPLVSAGPHAISVVPDNLPLPYFVAGEERRPVMVRTRETTVVDIPASQRK